MIVDTSAWVEYLRATGSRADRAVGRAIRTDALVHVVDVVRLELLAGAGSDEKAADLRRLLARFTAVPLSSPADHDLAASLYRSARATGETVRSLVDCLVAAVALRLDLPVLAQDRDYEVLTRVSPLLLA